MSNKNDTDFDVLISKADEDTTIVTSTANIWDQRLKVATAAYDPENKQYSVYVNEGQSPDDSLSIDDISELAISPQTSLTKVQRIAANVRKLVNMNDIVGKVVESINTNINTDYKLTYPHTASEGRNKKKKFAEAQALIHEVNDSINLKNIIRTAPTTAYVEGNWFCYLRCEDINNVQIQVFPLGVCEVSEYTANGNPILLFNIQQLRTRLQKTYKKNKKNKALFFENMTKEVEANYPKEVVDAFKAGESYAVLDSKYTGVIRVNNQDRAYGVSPILRALPDLSMLDTFANTDRVNSKAKAKKIIHQVLRKELIDDTNRDHFDILSFCHQNFMNSFKNATVVVSTPPAVEKIEYVEPSVEMTSVDTYNYYRSKVLATLGISFLFNEGTSVSSASISVTQLMRTINSITEQLEDILFRFYRQILIDNGFTDPSFVPHISIIDSELMEQSLRKDMAVLYYSTLNTSLETAYAMAGLDVQDEYQKRVKEKELKYDEVFTPRMTAYTNSGNSTTDTDPKVGAPSNKEKGKDDGGKGDYDKERNDALK